MYYNYDDCQDCNYIWEFCKLVDTMLKDIQHLESEIVRTRYELSKYLPHPENEFLKSDILSNLAARYSDSPAYQEYIQLLYNNQDPMESKEWVNHMVDLAHGHND